LKLGPAIQSDGCTVYHHTENNRYGWLNFSFKMLWRSKWWMWSNRLPRYNNTLFRGSHKLEQWAYLQGTQTSL